MMSIDEIREAIALLTSHGEQCLGSAMLVGGGRQETARLKQILCFL